MPGVWDIRDAAPPGAVYPDDTARNEFVGVAGGRLLTRWQAESGRVVQPLTALHDATTGKLDTSVVCDRPDGEKAVASPDDRFVAAGTVPSTSSSAAATASTRARNADSRGQPFHRHSPDPPRGHPRSRADPGNHRRLPVPAVTPLTPKGGHPVG
ncbi:hypothetical protein [Streptomyces sp. NPDC127164]|uniref:hypothetical protein n=1 Tax=Streptomyces sp. NPDC127164 TaxID=3345379 RepID=UPI00363780BA